MGFVWLIINGIDSIITYPIPDNGPPSRRVHRLELHGVVGRAMHLRNFWVFPKIEVPPLLPFQVVV